MTKSTTHEYDELGRAPPISASVELAHWVISYIPRNTKSVLDVACGKGIIPYILKSQFTQIERMTGIEIYDPYIEFVKERNIFDEVIKRDLTVLPLPLGDKEFDVAFCVEAIEHIEKQSAFALISEMERVARLVILTTPNIWNENLDSTLDGNMAQMHRSRWSPDDFRRRGYAVRGLGYFKWGPRAIRFGLNPLTYLFPELSTNLIAIKRTEPTR